MTIEVNFATVNDVSQIIKILQEHLIDITNQTVVKNFPDNGFLIRNLDRKEIEELILDQKYNLILTAKENNELLGYIISSNLEKIPKDLQKTVSPYLSLKNINSSNQILYHRQIAVKSGSKNVGKVLMSEFLRLSRIAGYKHIICKIVHQPITNHRSIMFHKKFNFNLIGVAKEENIYTGIYNCDL